MEKVAYEGWQDCVRLSNGQIELIITTAVGPRVIHCGFVGGQNLFGVMEDTKGLSGGDEWRLYGGHRLWHSPEDDPRSYCPDNVPVGVDEVDGAIRLTQAMEPTTLVQKEMEVSLLDAGNGARVLHRITNLGVWAIELAPWALTVMARGGEAIIPQPQGEFDSLLPNRRLTLWPYTNMSDPRLTWGEHFIRMRQDAAMSRRCKLGLGAEDGWLAYVLHGEMFLKRFEHDLYADYPDWGCSVEVFTNERILEVETLGPLTILEPGDTVEHEERWYLFRDIEIGPDEASLEAAVAARAREAL